MALEMVAVRLQPETIARVDALVPRLAARLPGSNLTQADALRAAVERGVQALEEELTPVAAKGAKRARNPR